MADKNHTSINSTPAGGAGGGGAGMKSSLLGLRTLRFKIEYK